MDKELLLAFQLLYYQLNMKSHNNVWQEFANEANR